MSSVSGLGSALSSHASFSNDNDDDTPLTNTIEETSAVAAEAISSGNALIPTDRSTIEFEFEFLPLYNDEPVSLFVQRKTRLLRSIINVKIVVRNVDSEIVLKDISLRISDLIKSSESQKVLKWLTENGKFFDEFMLISQKAFEGFLYLKDQSTGENFPFINDDALKGDEKWQELSAIFVAEAEEISEDDLDDVSSPPAGFEWPQEDLTRTSARMAIEKKVKQFRNKVNDEIETYRKKQLTADPIAREEIERIIKILIGLKKIVVDFETYIASSQNDASGTRTRIEKFCTTRDSIFVALKKEIKKQV